TILSNVVCRLSPRYAERTLAVLRVRRSQGLDRNRRSRCAISIEDASGDRARRGHRQRHARESLVAGERERNSAAVRTTLTVFGRHESTLVRCGKPILTRLEILKCKFPISAGCGCVARSARLAQHDVRIRERLAGAEFHDNPVHGALLR